MECLGFCFVLFSSINFNPPSPPPHFLKMPALYVFHLSTSHPLCIYVHICVCVCFVFIISIHNMQTKYRHFFNKPARISSIAVFSQLIPSSFQSVHCISKYTILFLVMPFQVLLCFQGRVHKGFQTIYMCVCVFRYIYSNWYY
jgi:hypothetical protein